MKQEEAEWIEYQNVMQDVIWQSGLNEGIFYDLRGNHDCFGVPEVGGEYDFYQKYSMNSRLKRHKNIQNVTLQVSGSNYIITGVENWHASAFLNLGSRIQQVVPAHLIP